MTWLYFYWGLGSTALRSSLASNRTEGADVSPSLNDPNAGKLLFVMRAVRGSMSSFGLSLLVTHYKNPFFI